MPLISTKGAASAQGFGLFAKAAGCCLCDGNKGIFALGNAGGASTTRNKYTYATCTSTACGVGASSAPGRDGSAMGNNTRGIFNLGCNNGCRLNTRNKYTYASCTSTASGVATSSQVSRLSSATGNNTRGIHTISCNGGYTDVRNKYTYASCTSTASGIGVTR
jgi:hypothetical protein